MWIFLNNSFLSIVSYKSANADRQDQLLVRSRVPGDIETFLGSATSDSAVAWILENNVFEDSSADYHYRLIAPTWLISECLTARVGEIEYPNFKDSVEDQQRHEAYMGVWSAMFRSYGGY